MNPDELKQLHKETNEKFIARVQAMIYFTCGCDPDRAQEILEECLKRNKDKQKRYNERRK